MTAPSNNALSAEVRRKIHEELDVALTRIGGNGGFGEVTIVLHQFNQFRLDCLLKGAFVTTETRDPLTSPEALTSIRK